MKSDPKLVHFKGLGLYADSPHRLLSLLDHAAGSGKGLAVRLVNLNTLANAAINAEYDSLLRTDGLNIVDGVPLKRIAGIPSKSGMRGPDLFRLSLRALSGQRFRHFLLGGSHDSLGDLAAFIERTFPSTNIVGQHSPRYISDITVPYDEYEEAIHSTKPNIVWVGLGGMKQDFEAARLAAKYGVVAIGVGAAFDFFSGTVREAPPILRNTGLEWVHRVANDPRRLASRYTIGAVHAARWICR